MNDNDPDAKRLLDWLPLGMIGSMATLTAAWSGLGTISDGYTLWDTVVKDYSAIHQPISGLGLGSTAAWMNGGFIASGVLSVAGAVGIGSSIGRDNPGLRRMATRWLALPGVGSILCGLFTLEQMPLHSLGFLLVVSPIAGYVIVGRRLRKTPGWERAGRLLAQVASPSIAGLTIAFFASFNPEAAGENRGVAGLTQRLLVLAIQGSLAAISIRAVRRDRCRDRDVRSSRPLKAPAPVRR